MKIVGGYRVVHRIDGKTDKGMKQSNSYDVRFLIFELIAKHTHTHTHAHTNKKTSV